MSPRSKYCLVGIPDHQGVLNVGGRIGASAGPRAFRHQFKILYGRGEVRERLSDLGDVPGLGADAAANHKLAADLIARAHSTDCVSVVVGGGHDHGYSQLLGLQQALGKRRLGCINIDAHFDLRKPEPLVSSGSPFYLAIESGVLAPSRFVEFGIQSHCNRPNLWEYAAKKKISIVPFEKVRNGKAVAAFKQALAQLSSRCDAIVVSMDLDAAAQAYAPGVSAPQAEGFTSSEMVQFAEIAGRSSKVVSFGIFELNPVHDIDHRTSRLGAVSAWHFLEQALDR